MIGRNKSDVEKIQLLNMAWGALWTDVPVIRCNEAREKALRIRSPDIFNSSEEKSAENSRIGFSPSLFINNIVIYFNVETVY